MVTDTAVLASIDNAFGTIQRPEHFTNFAHCDECAEHDARLQARDCETLRIEDVNAPGNDPLSFCSPQGIAYFFPALARFALAEPSTDNDWYADQLLFHLYSGFGHNAFFGYCSADQRQAIAQLLAYLISTKADFIDQCGSADEFLRCYELWSDQASFK